MPFLADERILVDPAHSKIILPAGGIPPTHIKEEELEGLAEIVVSEEGGGENSSPPICAAEYLSICPKIMRACKPLPPRPNLGWIKDLEEWDKPESTKLQEYLATFKGTVPSDGAS